MSIKYINWSDDTLKSPFVLLESSLNITATTLPLTGQGSRNWAEVLQENLVKLLENYASNNIEPPYVTEGQLWYNEAVPQLLLRRNGIWSIVWPHPIVTPTPTPTPILSITLSSSASWTLVDHDGTNYIAVAGGVALNNTVSYSSDGISWFSATLPSLTIPQAMTNNGSVIVVVGTLGVPTTIGSISFNHGVSWTNVTMPLLNYRAIAYGGGNFVATSESGSGGTSVSTDGVNWSAGGIIPTSTTRAICWSQSLGLFVAGGSSGTTTNFFTSTNGIAWTSRTAANINTIINIAWNGSIFVAVSRLNSYQTSTDGITWTARTFPSSVLIGTVRADSSGRFLAGGVASSSICYTSIDGINWILGPVLANTVDCTWQDIATNNSNQWIILRGHTVISNLANLVNI